MNTLKEIESAIERLPGEEFARLAAWMDLRVQKRWDEQLEKDSESGKLDRVFEGLVKEAGPGEEVPLDEFFGNQKLH